MSEAVAAAGAEDDGLKPPETLSVGPRPVTSTSMESSNYHVSTSDPVQVVAALDVGEAMLIGGNIIGSLRFSSSDRERKFLAEARGSFSFPLMEKHLMASGMSQMLQDIEDLLLKAFVASRCASRQLRIDNDRVFQLAKAEERATVFEKENTTLEEALTAALAEAKKNDEALEAARQDAHAAQEAKASVEEAKGKAEEAQKLAEDKHARGRETIQ